VEASVLAVALAVVLEAAQAWVLLVPLVVVLAAS
jgi:hypothetical protein